MNLKKLISSTLAAMLVTAGVAWAATQTLTLGTSTGPGGVITLFGSSSGSATVQTPAAAGTGTVFQLPGDNGTNNFLLKTDGSGVTSWAAGGSGTVTSTTLGPGLSKTIGTCNPGTDAITTTGTVNTQLCVVQKSSGSPYTVLTTDTGNVLVPTVASYTFTLPNPASGTKGTIYNFGSDGTNGFTLATVGASANFYGCTPVGAGATTLVVEQNIDVRVEDDGTGYKCTTEGTRTVSYALTYAPGINPNNLPIANFRAGRVIVGIRCTPEVLAGGTATISVVKAASATAISAGTALHSGSCNANSGAATDQDLTVTVTTLAAGDRLGITTTGTTIWTSSGIASGVVTVFVR